MQWTALSSVALSLERIREEAWDMVRLSLIALLVALLSGAWIEIVNGGAQPEKKPSEELLKPVNLAALNTKFDEDDPFLTRDGTRLFYTSNASKRFTLMESYQRKALPGFPGSEKWPAGVELEGQTSENDNRSPFLTADNHDLYYAEKTL